MVKEYRYSKVIIATMYILTPVIIVACVASLVWPFLDTGEEPPSIQYWFVMIPVATGLTLLMVLGLIDARNGKIILHNEGIIQISVLKKKAIRAEDITGYRIDENYTRVFSRDGKQIKISMYYEGRGNIQEWILRYPDLDQQDREAEVASILNNTEFGGDVKSRMARMKKARLICKILNVLAVGVTIWLIVFPEPYPLSVVAGALVVIASLVSLFVFKGLIKFEGYQESTYPSISFAAGLPSAALMLRAVIDISILDYRSFLIIAIPVVLVGLIFVGYATGEFQIKKAADLLKGFGIMVVLMMFTYGSLATLNAIFDRREPDIFKAVVLSKRISSGKTTSYYLTLAAWGPRDKPDEVTVSKTVYERADVDAPVVIYLYPGAMGIPWYQVSP